MDFLRRCCGVVFATIFYGLSGISAQAMTLTDALVLAYDSNPQLLAARAKLRAKDEDISQALAHWRPSIQFSAGQNATIDQVVGGTPVQNQLYSGQNPTRNYTITLTQSLYRGGRTLDETRRALASIRAERASLKSTEQKVFLAIVTDYCDVVRDTATLELDRHNEQFLSMKVSSTHAQFVGGELSRTDVAQAEAALAQAKAQHAIAESDLAKSRFNFKRDVGIDAGNLTFPAPGSWYPKTAEEAAEIAATQNPEVIAAQFVVDAAQEGVNDDIDQALPQLNLTGTLEHQEGGSFRNERENIAAIGVRLTVPFYSGGTLESVARAAEQNVTMYKHQADAQRAISAASANAAWSQTQANKLAIEAYTAQVKATVIALEGVQHQQTSGERTVLDVLNAEQALLQSRVNLNTAQHDEIVAEYTLAQALGRATARALRLPVKFYDPDDNFNDARSRWFGFGIEPR